MMLMMRRVMRMPFNSKPHAARVLAALLVMTAVALPSATAHAAGVYFTRTELLKSFFHDSDRVSYKTFDLDAAQSRRIATRLGYAVTGRRTVYYGEKDGQVTGYAVLDEELGQHKPISFGVLLGPEGQVQRVEVMVYREPKGEEIRRAQFRDQFVGKDAEAPVRSGHDIVAISGATISSHSLSVGVKRALVLVDELLLAGHSVSGAR
ncbi:MAG: FMN-binding protein [Deltaproteobacteria bacterium]|nr:MAG: FMN-binding protein [Deltaproteobacteria bacterium]